MFSMKIAALKPSSDPSKTFGTPLLDTDNLTSQKNISKCNNGFFWVQLFDPRTHPTPKYDVAMATNRHKDRHRLHEITLHEITRMTFIYTLKPDSDCSLVSLTTVCLNKYIPQNDTKIVRINSEQLNRHEILFEGRIR